MRLATWNVNSIKVRLEQVLAWSAEARPDVLALQETKVPDEQFPREPLEAAGWHVAFHGQRAYNGVAILSREPLANVAAGIPGLDDDQARVLAATVRGVRVVCVYVPNGEAVGSEKYDYKLRWMAALRGHLAELLRAHPLLAVAGDFNVAPEPRDVHDPGLWEGRVLYSEPEREAFRALLALGLCDTFRRFDQPEGSFSWWDYRMRAFQRNMGLRIDHILASPELCGRCTACRIDRTPRGWERPSDHAPVVADFDL